MKMIKKQLMLSIVVILSSPAWASTDSLKEKAAALSEKAVVEAAAAGAAQQTHAQQKAANETPMSERIKSAQGEFATSEVSRNSAKKDMIDSSCRDANNKPTACPQARLATQPLGQPPLGQPSLGQPPLGQPSLGQPSLGQPSLEPLCLETEVAQGACSFNAPAVNAGFELKDMRWSSSDQSYTGKADLTCVNNGNGTASWTIANATCFNECPEYQNYAWDENPRKIENSCYTNLPRAKLGESNFSVGIDVYQASAIEMVCNHDGQWEPKAGGIKVCRVMPPCAGKHWSFQPGVMEDPIFAGESSACVTNTLSEGVGTFISFKNNKHGASGYLSAVCERQADGISADWRVIKSECIISNDCLVQQKNVHDTAWWHGEYNCPAKRQIINGKLYLHSYGKLFEPPARNGESVDIELGFSAGTMDYSNYVGARGKTTLTCVNGVHETLVGPKNEPAPPGAVAFCENIRSCSGGTPLNMTWKSNSGKTCSFNGLSVISGINQTRGPITATTGDGWFTSICTGLNTFEIFKPNAQGRHDPVNGILNAECK